MMLTENYQNWSMLVKATADSLPKLARILDTVYCVFQHTPDSAKAYRRGPPATK